MSIRRDGIPATATLYDDMVAIYALLLLQVLHLCGYAKHVKNSLKLDRLMH